MVRYTVAVAVFLFFFTLSDARVSSNSPENGVIKQDLTNSALESEANPILLPSEKAKSNFFHNPGTEIETTGAETLPIQKTNDDFPESQTLTVNQIPLIGPLTTVSFRPINRHFRLKRLYPVRLCRHHFKRMKRFEPMEHFGQVPEERVSYGDDMILATENSDHAGMLRGAVRQIPARWMRFHHHDDEEEKEEQKPMEHFGHVPEERVSYGDDMILATENSDHAGMLRGDVRQIPARWMRFHHHHHHHDDDNDEEEKKPRFLFKKHHMFGKKFKKHFGNGEEDEREEKKNGVEEREEGGFMNHIRKFLNHF
ncbi:unnamed protein product [Ilex paraguariensis]|uniref:Uncharacterized protein n=1 Tax=Ilex paraguariensis TaxID=185542 RepID=A0ABC8T0Y9_9AQUA